MTPYLHFFAKIFGHVKKKQYLCTRFSKIERFKTPMGSPKISNFWGEREGDENSYEQLRCESY